MQLTPIDKDQYGKIVERLRIRLDLATFKCKHGYQHMDLYTMESFFPATTTAAASFNKSLIMRAGRRSTKRHHIMNRSQQQQQHRYYPLYQDNFKNESFPKALPSPNTEPKTTTHHRQQQQQQQQQPSSSSPPLSYKRSTSPSRTDELTAQLLLWMCHQTRITDTA